MRTLRSMFRWSMAIAFWSIVVSVLWVGLLAVVPPPVTWVMAREAGRHADEGGKVPPFRRQWVPLEAMARAMPLAVIASEDQRFFHHHGFEWGAIERALERNERRGNKRIKGASTISQQTAKNVFCWPDRSFLRKGVEAWFTVLVELLWSKERILEVYLNVAETGVNTYGVEAVARKCFNRPAAKLSPEQCAQIAAVVPRPRRFNACAPSGYVQGRRSAILRQMRNIGDQMDPDVRERVGRKLKDEADRQRRRR